MPASARSASPLSSPRAVSNASRAPVEASSSSDSAIWSSSTSPRRAVSAASSASPRLSWLLTATRVVTATVRIASLSFASLPTMRACVHGACRVSGEGGPESTEGTWTPSTPGLPSSRRRSGRSPAGGAYLGSPLGRTARKWPFLPAADQEQPGSRLLPACPCHPRANSAKKWPIRPRADERHLSDRMPSR